MKGKIQSSKNRKMIALVATIVVLLAGTATGVSLFLKDDGSASATGFNEPAVSNPEQPSGNNPSVENSEQIPGQEQGEQGDGDGENTGIANPEDQEGQISGVLGTTTQGTTGTTGTQQLPQESILYQDRLVAEDFLVGWTPIGISAVMADTNRFINRPILEISKASYTEADLVKTGELAIPEEIEYTAVRQGELVIYEIRVANVSNVDAKSIRVIDKVPAKTTLQEIGGEGKEENGVIIWIVDIPALTEVKLKFAVTVNDDAEGNAENIAIVNGDETNQVENPIIITEKVSEVYRNGEIVENAKVGDTIKYTISIKNTGDIEGTTKVTDKAPEGTTLIKESLKKATLLEDETILWDNVVIPAGEEKAVEFEVTINEDVTTSIKNIAIVSETPTNEVEDKVANIVGHKAVDKTVAMIGEELLYTITLANNGTVEGTVTVTDEIPEGTTYVENSVSGNGTYELNKITWSNVEVVPGTPVELTFKVKINLDRTTSIFNTAILDNEQIPEEPETKVANISGTKIVDKESAKVGETLTYTITLSNSGNATGTVTVNDVIPEGTEIKDASIEGYNAETNTMTWSNVEVEAGKTVDLTLEVVINEDRTTTVVNTATINGEEIPEKPETKVANITAIKASIADNPLKEMGNVKYNITLHNSGNVAGKVTVEDIVPEGTTLVPNSIKIDDTVIGSIENGKITWSEVEVGTENDVVLSFEVTVNVFEGETKTIRNDKAAIDGKQINSTEDIAEKAYIEVEIEKVWNDNNNEAGKRPESIKVQLKVANEVAREVVIGSSTEYGWSYTFEGLPKYDVNGNIINYTVSEAEVNKDDLYFYDSVTTGDMTKYTITNEFVVPGEEVKILVEKVWDDNNNKAGKRPTAITLQVNNEKGLVDSYTVTENDGWEYEFTLPKYDSLGNVIDYTVDEEEVSQGELYFYEKSIEGYTITNTFTVPNETVDVAINKVWVDTAAQQDKRPQTITLQVKNGDEVVASIERTAETGWNHTFTGLPKYDENGDEIEYTAGELMNSKFYTSNASGTTVTNTFTRPTETVDVTINKVWEDTAEQEDKRPQTITLQVKNGNEVVDSIERTAGSGWNHTFTGLPKYDENGDEIEYAAGELMNSKFYTSNASGTTVTNTFTRPTETVDVTINKVWVDTVAQQDKRPQTITLQVKNGDEVVASLERTAETGWSHTFTGLAKYDENGNEITYTAGELMNSKFYTSNASGTTVTNTFTRPTETVDVTINKVWVDTVAQQDKRPQTITLQVKNGDEVVASIERTAETGWSHTFSGLAKYDENGDEIEYTAGELMNSKFYTSNASGTTVTNIFTVPTETVSITVNKIWVDNNNQYGERPASIKILVKNANTSQTVREIPLNGNLTAGSWSTTVPELPKYDVNGDKISYTVDEKEVIAGDLARYTKTSVNGTTITNTLNSYTQYTANVEEFGINKVNKNVYIILDTSSSMNYLPVGATHAQIRELYYNSETGKTRSVAEQRNIFNTKRAQGLKTKMEVACDNVASLIRRIYNLSNSSTVEVITFNKDRSHQDDRVGVKVYQNRRATNATTGATLANNIDSITEAYCADTSYTPYKTYGTDIYAALNKASSEIDANKNKSAYQGKDNIVVFVGDGAPTVHSSNGYKHGEVKFSATGVPSGDVITAATALKGKVSQVYSLGVDLDTIQNENGTTEPYTPAQARAILGAIASSSNNYFDITNTTAFNTAFDKIFSETYSKKFSSSNEEYTPFITIQAQNGNVKLSEGIKISSDRGTETFTEAQINAGINGITYSANTFTIDTRIFTGNIKVQYTVQ